MQRDYLGAWLALARPLAVTGAAAAAGHGAGSGAGSAGDTQKSVTAEAIRVGNAVVNKYKGCVAGVSGGKGAAAWHRKQDSYTHASGAAGLSIKRSLAC